MKYTTLPQTSIKVSKICLGTMTWGEQNTETEGHQQMDYAVEQGINFFDVAELYPVPARAETYGETERIIGTWFKKTGNRDKIILASKITGPGAYTAHIRKNGFSKEAITEAIHNSLKRLQTDYIDLYQLHWPERPVNSFGVRDFPYSTKSSWQDNFGEVVETLNNFIKQGKIHHYGLSNETPWGTMRYINEADAKQMPRPITIQNSYSLLNRTFEGGLSEISIRENIGLLAYSPLAFGVLTGKYLNYSPKDARVTLFPRLSRYSSAQCADATVNYLAVAEKYGLTPAKLALAFINQLPFVTSNIIGATKMEQLKENIESINVELSEEAIKDINAVHAIMPNPAC
ncbi:MAG: NADP(H)-dependent aldo-keto reductase [Flavobacteriaceae bacterium]|nr:NADP(H)-dependent aldo-keto reductase [Flavobacteriaceae bacterium]MCB0484585.1 NADP(H)-dependent aldo-keto reductase [Flavobacteriaceae bacterium]